MAVMGVSNTIEKLLKLKITNYISIRRFGFATGLKAAVLYLGCTIVMATIGYDKTVKFFNSLLHGFEATSIIRMNISLGKKLLGSFKP